MKNVCLVHSSVSFITQVQLHVAYFPLVAKRYKSLHKYEYLYEAESLNTLNGAINGPKVSCKVQTTLMFRPNVSKILFKNGP